MIPTACHQPGCCLPQSHCQAISSFHHPEAARGSGSSLLGRRPPPTASRVFSGSDTRPAGRAPSPRPTASLPIGKLRLQLHQASSEIVCISQSSQQVTTDPRSVEGPSLCWIVLHLTPPRPATQSPARVSASSEKGPARHPGQRALQCSQRPPHVPGWPWASPGALSVRRAVLPLSVCGHLPGPAG